jgi:hypothetical protein
MMALRKCVRSSVVRELLQKLATPSSWADAPPLSGGMLSLPRPLMVHSSRTGKGTRAAICTTI